MCVDHNECHAVDEKQAGKLDSSDKFAKSVTEEARKRFRARHKSKFDFEFDVNNKLMGFEFIWPGAQVVGDYGLGVAISRHFGGARRCGLESGVRAGGAHGPAR